jgi:release factor glutamine methyltransferase
MPTMAAEQDHLAGGARGGGPDAPVDMPGAHDTVAWSVFVAEATRRLDAAGVANADREAKWLVARAAGVEPAELALVSNQAASTRHVAFFDAMLDRREAGEPIQYVLGQWAFRSLELVVDRRVLIPRPETEQLVDVALAELDRSPTSMPVVVDLGTGSGAIALAIATERRSSVVWATDVSLDALAVASANVAGIGRDGARVQLREGSWFDALPPELVGSIDVIVSNPPYVAPDDEVAPDVAAWEPAVALWPGATGLEALEVIVDGAGSWLRPGGSVIVELAPWQAVIVSDRASAAGLENVHIGSDLTGRPRWVSARRPGGPGPP